VERNFDLERVQLHGWKHGFSASTGYPRRSRTLFVYRDPIDWTVSKVNTPHPDMELVRSSDFILGERAIFDCLKGSRTRSGPDLREQNTSQYADTTPADVANLAVEHHMDFEAQLGATITP
jgi:hypothetical protein